jgi:hypothetical protein
MFKLERALKSFEIEKLQNNEITIQPKSDNSALTANNNKKR